MGQTSEDMSRLTKLLEILMSVVGYTAELQQNLLKVVQNQGYVQDKGIEALLKHIEKGGKVNQFAIDTEHKEDFERRIKEANIPFVTMEYTTEEGEVKTNYMFRDTDSPLIRNIKELMKEEISNNSKELSIHRFKELMEGKEVGIAGNLTVEQLYAFRANVKDTDIKFCVVQDKPEEINGVEEPRYKIYTSNSDKMENILIKVSYDLANDTKGFKKDVNTYKDKRVQFFDKLENITEPMVIFDKKYPNNFMVIDKNNYSMHSIVEEPERQPDGSTVEVIRDKVQAKIQKNNPKMIFERANTYNNPVMIRFSDFNMVEKINKDGIAILTNNPDEFKRVYEEIEQKYKGYDTVIDRYPQRKPRYERKEVTGFMYLPMSIVMKMANDLPFITYVNDGSIAFPKEYQAQVDKYIAENITNNLTPLQKRAFEMQIQGRCGNFTPDFTKNNDKDFYILDPDNTNFIVNVDANGIHIIEDGVETKNCPIYDDNFEKFLDIYTNGNQVKNPVILTAEEMTNENKAIIIQERANNTVENKAVEKILDIENVEKQELIDYKHNINDLDKSKEQEKAVDEKKHISFSSTELNNSLFTELQSANISRSVKKDVEMDI